MYLKDKENNPVSPDRTGRQGQEGIMKTMEDLKLQYQLSNGSWVSCDNPATQWEPARDRTEDFLLMCEKFNGMLDDKIVPIFRATRPLARDEVLTALLAGRELRNDKNDWYSNCRSGSAYEAKLAARRTTAPPVKLVKCSCGHTIPSGSVMSASLGSSCPDCYDRLSM